MQPSRLTHSSPCLALLLLLPGCSSGGEEERPVSAVKQASEHYLFGVVGRSRFTGFPTTTQDLASVDGRLKLLEDGNYELRTGTGDLLSASAYFLETNGAFSIQIRTSTQSILYRGGLGLSGETDDVFLTDRFGEGVGLYIGCEHLPNDSTTTPLLPDMVGDWHMMSMHAVMAPGSPTPDVDQVARTFGGRLTFAADGSLAGAGIGSDAAVVNLRGNPGDVTEFDDGRFAIEITYDPSGAADYDRGFTAGLSRDASGTPRVLVGLDPDEAGDDEATGLLAMIRYRTLPFAEADLAGTYQLGLWTIFPNPDASGIQSAIGTIELTRDNRFTILARDAGIPGVRDPIDFDYVGTWQATQFGNLTFQVEDTGEAWVGAFDDEYETLVFVDPVVRATSNLVELNFGFAIRPKE